MFWMVPRTANTTKMLCLARFVSGAAQLAAAEVNASPGTSACWDGCRSSGSGAASGSAPPSFETASRMPIRCRGSG